MGYAEFELDIPGVMRTELPKYFDAMSASPLTLENLNRMIPNQAQGAYFLFLENSLVYIGKTDAEVGFRSRLLRHLNNVRHRHHLDPEQVRFKAVRIFVFSNFDLETMLIDEYAKREGGRPVWNYSGFGSNDPGHRRESQDPAKFDLQYSVDIDREVAFLPAGEHPLMSALLALKNELPYLLRYDTGEEGTWRTGHVDMIDKMIVVPQRVLTTRLVLTLILDSLPEGWQVSALPGRVILYKEDTTYGSLLEVLRKAATAR
ncbi:MAG: GIY-YIG nuclease family protein [Cucumibacter sp.]